MKTPNSKSLFCFSSMFAALCLGGSSVIVQAAESRLDPRVEKHLTIDRVITEMSEETISYDLVPEGAASEGMRLFTLEGGDEGDGGLISDLEIVDVVVDKVINIGKKIWEVVKAGKPVVSAKEMRATALPQGAKDWRQLQGWEAPRSRTYRIAYTNLYGMTVVDYSFRITYTYGGNVDGVGRYLTNVSVVPAKASVAWGYSFDSEASVPSVINLGSKTAPVAGMELQIKWTVKTALKHEQQQSAYFVDGKGGFKDLN